MVGIPFFALRGKTRAWVCVMSVLGMLLVAAPTIAQAASSRAKVVKTKKAVVIKKQRHAPVVQSTRAATPGKYASVDRKSMLASRPLVTPRASFGQLAGLHLDDDALNLKSSVALVVDQDTSEVLFSKNDKAVLPIASLTKLMTGVVIRDANLSMDELITVSQEDVDTEKGSSSRLRVGSVLSRGELLHLALMSSENRAAHALGRTFPGGLPVFTGLMNAKARALGMKDTRYVEPTGLSSANQSSAQDLVKLVDFAHRDALLRELTTSTGYQVEVGARTLQYNNTNRLVKNPTWDIGLQKTGYISEAGQCLVMQAQVAGRKLIMVFLDSAGKLSRLGDAERVRSWIESAPSRTNSLIEARSLMAH